MELVNELINVRLTFIQSYVDQRWVEVLHWLTLIVLKNLLLYISCFPWSQKADVRADQPNKSTVDLFCHFLAPLRLNR